MLIIYPYFMHYRLGVLRELEKQESLDLRLMGGEVGERSIRPITARELTRFQSVAVKSVGPFVWLRSVNRAALSRDQDVVVLSPALTFLNVWPIMLVRRILGRPTVLWGNAWKERDAGIRKTLKSILFGMATALFVYGPTARRLAIQSGTSAARVFVTYNSVLLDASPGGGTVPDVVTSDAGPRRPFTVGYIGRFVSWKKLALLIEAIAHLRHETGENLGILLGGEGEERERLEDSARAAGVPAEFVGPVYDPDAIGLLYQRIDLTVCPGDCGLLAIQSISHGVPVLTHDNFAGHGPEVDAIRPGVSGDFFREDDARSLAELILKWTRRRSDGVKVPESEVAEVTSTWSAGNQAEVIARALAQVVRK